MLYAVFKVNGRTRWKSLATDDVSQARQFLAEEKARTSKVDWRQSRCFTLCQLVEAYRQNPMGLAASTLKIRNGLLDVFMRTWKYGLGIRVSDVKSIMLKTWSAERRHEQSLKASGVNNYIRMLHGLFEIAVESGAVAESPARAQKLLREENPERLTPTWEQAISIINAVKRQNGKDVLSAMLLLGLGQAELANLHGEHIDFGRGEIIVRRQKGHRDATLVLRVYGHLIQPEHNRAMAKLMT